MRDHINDVVMQTLYSAKALNSREAQTVKKSNKTKKNKLRDQNKKTRYTLIKCIQDHDPDDNF